MCIRDSLRAIVFLAWITAKSFSSAQMHLSNNCKSLTIYMSVKLNIFSSQANIYFWTFLTSTRTISSTDFTLSEEETLCECRALISAPTNLNSDLCYMIKCGQLQSGSMPASACQRLQLTLVLVKDSLHGWFIDWLYIFSLPDLSFFTGQQNYSTVPNHKCHDLTEFSIISL